MQVRVCVCVDVSFHFSGMNAWECDTGSLGKYTLNFFFFKKLPSHFLAWMPLLQSCSGVHVWSPACGVVSILHFRCFNRSVAVSHDRPHRRLPTRWSRWPCLHGSFAIRVAPSMACLLSICLSGVEFWALCLSSERAPCQRHELQILSPNLSLIFSSSLWELLQGRSFRF